MSSKGTVSIPYRQLHYRKLLGVAELDQFMKYAKEAAKDFFVDLQELVPRAEILAVNVDSYRGGPGVDVVCHIDLPREQHFALLKALQSKGYSLK